MFLLAACTTIGGISDQCLCFHYWGYFSNFGQNNWQFIIDVVERLCYNHLYSFLGRCDSWSNSGEFFVWIGPLAIVTRSQWPSLPTDNWSKFLLLWQKLKMTKKYLFKSAKYFFHLKKRNIFWHLNSLCQSVKAKR